ncbi:MAG TPA: ester cyclase [Chloroflexota bacterium]|nr:ester cyclase [Chloroflexota bacterium]
MADMPDKDFFRKMIEVAFVSANTTGDATALEPYYHPHHQIHTDFHNTDKEHLEGMRAEAQIWSKIVSDMTAKAEHIVIDGDMVAVHWRVSARHHGTHQHTVAGHVKGSGQTVHASGMLLLKVRDGKIEEEWRYDDILQVLINSGAVTIPKAAA